MSTGTVPAVWAGPAIDARLPDGTLLVAGETVVDVPAAEAHLSDNWRPKGAAAVKAAEKAAGTTGDTTEPQADATTSATADVVEGES